MYPGLGLGLGLQLLLLLLLLPLLLLACAMVKTPASDFSAEISAKWALWPLPGPGLANRGRSAARSSAEQKLLPSNEIFRTCYCPCPQSSVAVAVSLAARCLLLWALWQREPPMAGSIGFRYSFTMGNIAEQPHCDSGWSSSCCLLAFGIFNFMFCCSYCCCCCRVSVKHDKHFF